MADFAKLVLDADTRGLKKAETDLDGVSAKATDVARKVGESMTKLGAGLTIGVTAPLTLFGKGAVQAAIDAQELQSMFDTTFGSMSASMNRWAEETGNAMGRSTQELQQSAAMFHGFFKDMMPEGEAAEFSRKLTVLAQDVASFKNLSNDDAQRRLFAAATGEYESLKALGVVINDNVLAAKGMEMGFGSSTSAMSEQEKVLARVAILQEKFADASGDVERTSGSMANQIKAAQARFSELQVSIGDKLIPVLNPLLEKLNSALDWFTQLPGPVQETVVVIGGLSAASGPLLMVVGKLTTAVPLLAKAMTFLFAHPVILGAAALIGGIYLAWKNWDKITAIVENLFVGVKTWLQDKLGAVFNWVAGKLKWVGDKFFELYDRVVGNSYIPDMVDQVGQHIGRLQTLMVDPAVKANERVGDSFASLAQSVTSSIQSIVGSLKSGDWLGAVEGAVGILGKLGLIGGGIPSTAAVGNMNAAAYANFARSIGVPGLANGGAFDVGGIPGVDRNLLSINGIPRARVSARERVHVVPPGHFATNDNGRGASRGDTKLHVEVVANNNGFAAIVRDHAGQVLAQAAPSLIKASMNATHNEAAKRQRRQLAG